MTSMTRSPPVQLLLDAWREVGRHLDIAESMAALTPRLAALVPLRRVRVRVLDAPEKRLDTLASVSRTGPVPTGTSRTVLNDRELAELVGWCRKGRAQALILGETSDVVALPSDARTPGNSGCFFLCCIRAIPDAHYLIQSVEIVFKISGFNLAYKYCIFKIVY